MYSNKSLNVVIPAAGRGSRVKDIYPGPKPLLPINGKPLIHYVIDSLEIDANYIFILLRGHEQEWNVSDVIRQKLPDAKFIFIDEVTQGAAETVLAAQELIDNPNPLLISDCDQMFHWDADEFFKQMRYRNADGGSVTFQSQCNTKSYCALNDKYRVIRTAEKEVISEFANTGTYYWRHGYDYVFAAKRMIRKNVRVRGEFYVSMVFNENISMGHNIQIFNIKEHCPLGTKEEIEEYFNVQLSKNIN